MALIGQIAIAMRVDTAKFKAGLSRSTAMLNSFQATAIQSGGALRALFAGAAVYGAAKGIGKLISAASDLNESVSKTQAVFGEGSKIVIEAAQQMADAFGTSKNEFLGGAATLGGLFKGAGFDPRKAAEMSVAFTKLAADVASFANISFEEAFTKLKAGLTGESEPLKSLGILINEDRVKAQAFAMGLAKAGETLTEQAKVQARAALIMGSLADAQGDLARTATGVANASRGVSGAIENLAATIGTVLQPVAQAVLGDLNVAVSALGLAWEASGYSALASSLTTTDAAQGQAQSIGYVQSAIMRIADGWGYVRLAFLSVGSIIIKGLTYIIDLVGFFARGLDLILKGLGQAETGAGQFFTNLAQNTEGLSDKMWAGFEAGLKDHFEGPAASQAVADLFAKARAKIEASRKELGATPKNGAALAQGAAPKAGTKATELKFASAMSAGSQEAVNTILRSKYGNQQQNAANKPAEATAKNTAETNRLLLTIASQIGRAIAPQVGQQLAGLGNF